MGGDLPLGEAEIIQAIGAGIKEHSKNRPLSVSEDTAGDGGFDYPVSSFSSWSDGFSGIRRVEYPVDDTSATPKVLQDDEWRMYDKPDGEVLRFLTKKPIVTESFRTLYTALHTCDDTTCTVKTSDEEAVQSLCAADFCAMLSAYYAQDQDSTIEADSVDHSNKAREYEKKRNMYRKTYFARMGIEEGKTTAASVTMDQDATPSWQGDHLTHPNRYR